MMACRLCTCVLIVVYTCRVIGLHRPIVLIGEQTASREFRPANTQAFGSLVGVACAVLVVAHSSWCIHPSYGSVPSILQQSLHSLLSGGYLADFIYMPAIQFTCSGMPSDRLYIFKFTPTLQPTGQCSCLRSEPRE